MRTMSIAVAAALLGLLFAATPAHAQRWEKLGTRVVSFAAEKDTIPVTASEGRFTALKIDVDEGNLVMFNIRVTFGNGESFSPKTRLNFGEDTRSRTLDLPGGARVIRKVEFWYKSRLRKGRATLTLYGRHPGEGGGEAPVPTPAPAEGRWERLGTRIVNFGAEKDTIPVTASEGLFTALKIEVDNGNLEMYNIRITFGNGEQFSPPTRLIFKEGELSRTLDLPGDARVIRKVEFWYRSKLRKGRATCTLYGRHPG